MSSQRILYRTPALSGVKLHRSLLLPLNHSLIASHNTAVQYNSEQSRYGARCTYAKWNTKFILANHSECSMIICLIATVACWEMESCLKMKRRTVVRAICLRSATLFLQSIHLLLALLLAVAAILGFAAAPPMFDLLSSYRHHEAQAINDGHGLFQVSTVSYSYSRKSI